MISGGGNIEWPSKSPDLSECDFFLKDYLKSKLYEKKPWTTVDLKQNIRDEVAGISPTKLHE